VIWVVFGKSLVSPRGIQKTTVTGNFDGSGLVINRSRFNAYFFSFYLEMGTELGVLKTVILFTN